MAPPDLDRHFDDRRTSQLTAQQVFTNRTDELNAFDRSLEHMRRSVEEMADFPPSTGRSNVLAYYGLGGIGKTALSYKLQDRFLASTIPGKRIACRISFDRAEYIGLEDVLLALRASFGSVHQRWSAFDIAFQVYWQRKYPGLPVQQFVAARSGLSGLAAAVDVGQQIAGTCEELVFAGIPALTTARNVSRAVLPAVMSKLRTKQLFAAFPAFGEIVSAESVDEMLPFLPALLSWDLYGRNQQKPHAVTVFLDTFECIQGGETPRGPTEDRIARLVYLMPNVLFVVTGRNRLTWGDPSPRGTSLHYSGPARWPYLAPGGAEDPRQHRVGALSASDAMAYLESRLVFEGRPAITKDIASAIVEHSEGLPLYLDLSAQYFDTIVSQGRVPSPQEFKKAFSAIVVRLLSDLSVEERNLARSAAVLGVFDRQLLAKLHPTVGSACLDYFFGRSFVEPAAGGWLNFSIHPRLQDSILEFDHETTDYWSADDRARQADLALDIMALRLAPAMSSPVATEPGEIVDSFAFASRLLRFAGSVPTWLFELAYLLRLLWRSSALHYPASLANAPPNLAVYSQVCSGMAYRCEERYEDSEAALNQALATGILDSYGQLFCKNRLGKTLEEGGHRTRAAGPLAEGATITGSFAATAQKDLARFNLFVGDSGHARRWAGEHRDSENSVRRHQALDLLGWVEFIDGRFDSSARYFDATCHDGDEDYVAVQYHVAIRHLALATSWLQDSQTSLLPEQAYERNAELNVAVGMAQSMVANAVSKIAHEPLAATLLRFENAAELFADKDRSGLWLVYVGRLAAAVVYDDPRLASQSAQDLLGHVSTHQFLPQMSELARLFYLPGRSPAWVAEERLSLQGEGVANWIKAMLNKRSYINGIRP